MVGEFNSAKSGFPLEWSINGRSLEGLGFKFLFPFHKGTSINNMLGCLDCQECNHISRKITTMNIVAAQGLSILSHFPQEKESGQ
jgi:hypothetical protein